MKYEQEIKSRGDTVDDLSVRKEIENLIKIFPNYRKQICELGKNRWEDVMYRAEEKFISKKHYSQDFHWAWERFKEPKYAVSFVDPTYKYLDYLISEKEVYFLVEDHHAKLWAFEGDTKLLVNKIIPELVHLKEYYLLSKKFEWLICENHHNVLCATGDGMVNRILKFVKENREEIIV